jgi:hypothetical protein
MPNRMSPQRRPAHAFSYLVSALEQELLLASDEEIMAAATQLGMNPTMQGSAAYAGLKYPTQMHLADFYGAAAHHLMRRDSAED